jgi:hypothetical protein
MTKLADLKFKSVRMNVSNFHASVLDLPAVPLLLNREGDRQDADNDQKQLLADCEVDLLRKLLASIPHGEHSGMGIQSALETCRVLQNNMCVHALPECIIVAQVESLNRMHGACTSRLRAAHTMSFCVLCAINGKGFQCKLRVCCISGKLSCVACPAGV